jgi:hypothetical protein
MWAMIGRELAERARRRDSRWRVFWTFVAVLGAVALISFVVIVVIAFTHSPAWINHHVPRDLGTVWLLGSIAVLICGLMKREEAGR